MAFEQNEKTRLFIQAVQRLVDMGEVKNRAAIVEALKWDTSLMSNVMNGRKNVPNDVYRKFTEVFQINAPAPTDADYRDKYIDLLERRVSELEAQRSAPPSPGTDTQSRLSRIEATQQQILDGQRYMLSTLVAYHKRLLELQVGEKKLPAEVRKIQEIALADAQGSSQQGRDEGTGGN